MAAVAYEKKDHVAVVTLKNAGKRHWSEPEWIAEVQAAVKQVERDLDVRRINKITQSSPGSWKNYARPCAAFGCR